VKPLFISVHQGLIGLIALKLGLLLLIPVPRNIKILEFGSIFIFSKNKDMLLKQVSHS